MKKIFSLLLAMMILCASLTPAYANTAAPYASDTLASYSASLTRRDDGRVRLFFDVYSSTGSSTRIGAEKIVYYLSSGTRVITVYGSTDNGMIEENSAFCASTDIRAVSNFRVYAEVTVFCQQGNLYDSRVIKTNMV